MDVAGIRDIDEVRHQRGHRFVANRFHRPAVVLVDGAEETRSSFIYSDGDTNATEGGGSSTTKTFFDLTQM